MPKVGNVETVSLDRAKLLFLKVILGRQTMYHTSYIQEKIDLALMAKSISNRQSFLDSYGQKKFDKLLQDEG